MLHPVTLDSITFDHRAMAGRTCIRGLRFLVSVILGLIAGGASSEYPDLETQCDRTPLVDVPLARSRL